MPIYVYRCQSCQEYSEALQKASDPPLLTCPHCSADALIKVIAPVGVIFKGTGFHKNDYSASGGAAKKSSTPDKPAADSGSAGEAAPAAAESKAESKSEGSSSGGDNKVA